MNVRNRTGFSFTEVLFAVIILGIGFIMIAAVFPVAIQQSKSTADETSTAAYASNSSTVLNDIASDATMLLQKFPAPSVPQVVAIPTRASINAELNKTDVIWQSMSGNVISSTDPRYAWVPLCFRGTDPATGVRSSFAQVIMLCVQATLQPTFTDADIHPNPPPSNPAWNAPAWFNLRPRPVAIQIANGDDNLGNPDLIAFQDSSTATTIGAKGVFVNSVAQGCYVIVRADTDVTRIPTGRLTGKIYRVGVARPDMQKSGVPSVYYSTSTTPPKQVSTTLDFSNLKVFELSPGNDFQYIPADQSFNPAWPEIGDVQKPIEAWIIGKSFANPNDITQGFDGPAMDVGIYSTFVYCKQ